MSIRMRLLDEYIQHEDLSVALKRLLRSFQENYSFQRGKKPSENIGSLISSYNLLGAAATKTKYEISQNLSRNLTGSLFQDFLTELALEKIFKYKNLRVFCEARVPYGTFNLWDKGEVIRETPGEISDLAIGYLFDGQGNVVECEPNSQRTPTRGYPRGMTIEPLIIVNSKIRVSQGEFFDWYGRKQRLNHSHPACFSTLIALRAEMNRKIPKITRVEDSFFLLGDGGEGRVTANSAELARLIQELELHLSRAMD